VQQLNLRRPSRKFAQHAIFALTVVTSRKRSRICRTRPETIPSRLSVYAVGHLRALDRRGDPPPTTPDATWKTGKGDHRHIVGREEPYRFVSVAKLRRDFEADVRKYGGRDEKED
jgi:hypothetical protein